LRLGPFSATKSSQRASSDQSDRKTAWPMSLRKRVVKGGSAAATLSSK